MLRFGYQNLNANLFTSAVDVYQVIFSVFRVSRFIRKEWLPYVHSPLSTLLKKLHDTNKYITVSHAHKYVDHVLVKCQFTLFCHANNRGIFTKPASLVVHQRNNIDLHSLKWTYCFKPLYGGRIHLKPITYLLRELFNATCLLNGALNLS